MNHRYSRQTLFAPIGLEGQKKLSRKHVLIVGAGALGTGNAEILVRAGVGTVTIVDRDVVEWSNLQRQLLYNEQDARLNLPKAVAARERLSQINTEVHVRALVLDVTERNIMELLTGVDVIIDATDNFETRFLLNDAAQKSGVPWIYGACTGSYGITYTFVPEHTPCLNCLMELMPMGGETCDTAGVIASAVQMVVSYQTAEALKILVEDHTSLHGKLIAFDLWRNKQSAVNVDDLKKCSCNSCGEKPAYPYLSGKNQTRAAVLCGRDTVQIRPAVQFSRDLWALADSLPKQDGKIEVNPYLVVFTVGRYRMVFFQDGRVLVHGTKELSEAKSLYHKYIG